MRLTAATDRAGDDDTYKRLTSQIEAKREELEKERSALERQSRRERRRREERNRRKEELRQRHERDGVILPGLRREPTPGALRRAARAAEAAEADEVPSSGDDDAVCRERARRAVCEDDEEESDLSWLLHEIGSGPVPEVMEGVDEKQLTRLRAQHRAVVKLEVKRMQRAAVCNKGEAPAGVPAPHRRAGTNPPTRARPQCTAGV